MLMDYPTVAGNTTSQYIKKAELAERLRRTPRTVEKWMKLGIIPYLKIGHSVLFRWEDVERNLVEKFGVISLPRVAEVRKRRNATSRM